MSPSVPELDSVQNHSTANLPYGALPVRPDQPVTPPRGSPDTDALGVSRLNPETSADSGHAAEPADSVPHEGEAAPSFRPGPANLPWDRAAEYSIDEHGPEPSSEVDLATARGEADDDVHFGVAAKALSVSRKTVERMVKREQLERGPSGAPATVSKRSLVAVLEQRRQGGHAVRSTGLTPGPSGYASLDAPWSHDATAELQELLRPMLEPLLEDFIAARTRAAVLESQLQSIEARAGQERARDELLLALATGGWRQRRKARQMALTRYVLRDDVKG